MLMLERPALRFAIQPASKKEGENRKKLLFATSRATATSQGRNWRAMASPRSALVENSALLVAKRALYQMAIVHTWYTRKSRYHALRIVGEQRARTGEIAADNSGTCVR